MSVAAKEVLDAAMAKKPPHGSPCNNCGGCCMEVLCVLGRHVFGFEDGPCPALETTASGYGCGLVSRPHEFTPVKVAIHGRAAMSKAASVLIGAGIGCDAQADGEEPNIQFLADMHLERFTSRAAMAIAAMDWGIKPWTHPVGTDPIEASKILTAGLLTPPITEWCDAVKDGALNAELAFTSLSLFLGHILAGVAVELNVRPLASTVGEIIAEAMAEEMSEITNG